MMEVWLKALLEHDDTACYTVSENGCKQFFELSSDLKYFHQSTRNPSVFRLASLQEQQKKFGNAGKNRLFTAETSTAEISDKLK